MRNSELVLILFLSCLLGLLVWIVVRNQQKQLNLKDQVIQNLLNRILSGDIKTYQIMSRITSSESDPAISIPSEQSVGMSDMDEIRRSMAIHGLGDPIFDEATDPNELAEMFKEMGVDNGTDPPN